MVEPFTPLIRDIVLGPIRVKEWNLENPASRMIPLLEKMETLPNAEEFREQEEKRLNKLIEESPEAERAQYIARKRLLLEKRLNDPSPGQIRGWQNIRVHSAEPGISYLLANVIGDENSKFRHHFEDVEQCAASLVAHGSDEGILSLRTKKGSAVDVVIRACNLILDELENVILPALLQAHKYGASRVGTISSKLLSILPEQRFIHGAELHPAFALSNFPSKHNSKQDCKEDLKQDSKSKKTMTTVTTKSPQATPPAAHRHPPYIRVIQYDTQQRQIYYETVGISEQILSLATRIAIAWIPCMAPMFVETKDFDPYENGIPLPVFLMKMQQLTPELNPIPFEMSTVAQISSSKEFSDPKRFARFILYKNRLVRNDDEEEEPEAYAITGKDVYHRPLDSSQQEEVYLVEQMTDLANLLPDQSIAVRLHMAKSNLRLSNNVVFSPTTVIGHRPLPMIGLKNPEALDIEDVNKIVRICPRRVFALKPKTIQEERENPMFRDARNADREWREKSMFGNWYNTLNLSESKSDNNSYLEVKAPDACVLCSNCISDKNIREHIQFDEYPHQRFEYVVGSRGGIRTDQIFPMGTVIMIGLIQQYRRGLEQYTTKQTEPAIGIYQTPSEFNQFLEKALLTIKNS